jgi:hypothetical protein
MTEKGRMIEEANARTYDFVNTIYQIESGDDKYHRAFEQPDSNHIIFKGTYDSRPAIAIWPPESEEVMQVIIQSSLTTERDQERMFALQFSDYTQYEIVQFPFINTGKNGDLIISKPLLAVSVICVFSIETQQRSIEPFVEVLPEAEVPTDVWIRENSLQIGH